MQINKDENYWKLHKQLLNNKLNSLNNADYDDVVSNPTSILAIKIKNDIEEEIIKMFNKEKSLTS